MEHVRFGRTGLRVSRLCLGTMTFGVQCDEAQSFSIMDAATEGGINFFDTADVYPLGGDLTNVGRTEEIIGKWVKGRRDQYVIATKCFGRMGPNPWDEGTSRKHVLDAVDASLRRLGTDYIDLYQVHAYDPNTPLDETLEALDTVVKSGKARYVGVSNWLAFRLARGIGRTEVKNLVPLVSVQPRYNLLFRNFERDLFPLCQEEGVAVIPYNPLAGGFLTGKHTQGPAPEGRFSLGWAGKMYRNRHWHEAQFNAVADLKGVADEAGLSLAQMAVGWVLANPAVTSPIVGASKPGQLADALAAAHTPLPAELKTRLDEMTTDWRAVDADR